MEGGEVLLQTTQTYKLGLGFCLTLTLRPPLLVDSAALCLHLNLIRRKS